MGNMTRNVVMNIFEVGCYDQYKDMLMGAGMKEGIALHFTSAISAAFTACVFTNPLDMVKNRWITNDGTFSSIGDVVMQTMKKEGPQGFFKGFTPFFLPRWFLPRRAVLLSRAVHWHLQEVRVDCSRRLMGHRFSSSHDKP